MNRKLFGILIICISLNNSSCLAVKEINPFAAGNTAKPSVTKTPVKPQTVQSPPVKKEAVDPEYQLEYETLVSMAQKTFRSLEEEDYKNFLKRSKPFLEKYPNNLNIWIYQAKVSMVINDQNAGAIAAQKIKALGGFNSTNPEMRKLMINLNEKGYFDKNLGLLGAVMYSQPDIALKLIQAAADVNAKDTNGSAIEYAAKNKLTEVVNVLIQAGVKINAADPFMKETTIVKFLIQSGIDINNINTKHTDGKTALMKAAKAGQTEVIKALIQAGADLNAKDKYGRTALMNAADEGQTEIVKVLIQAKADLNAKDNSGSTALIDAAFKGHVEVVKALIQAKADVNAKNNSGYTALIDAAFKGDVEVVKALIQAGSDLNATTNGNTALSYAAYKGQTEVVKVLIQAGADVNAKDKDAYTALIWAAYYGKTEVVKALIQAGADVNFKTKYGDTALMKAKTREIEELLRNAGAR